MKMPMYLFTWKNSSIFHCINRICKLIKKIVIMGDQDIGKIKSCNNRFGMVNDKAVLGFFS